MTRREREITDQNEINRILEECKYLHLGLVDDGKPYVVPMNYGIDHDNAGNLIIYLHGATTGRKLDIIRKNSDCCFTMECNIQPFEGAMACQYGVAYECVMGVGQIHLIDDPAERERALQKIMNVEELSAKYRPLPAKFTE